MSIYMSTSTNFSDSSTPSQQQQQQQQLTFRNICDFRTVVRTRDSTTTASTTAAAISCSPDDDGPSGNSCSRTTNRASIENTTSTASTTTTTTTNDEKIIIGVFLLDGTWNKNRRRNKKLQSVDDTVARKDGSYSNTRGETSSSSSSSSRPFVRSLHDTIMLGIDTSSSTISTVYDVIYIDENDDDVACYIGDNGYPTSPIRTPTSTLPQLVVTYQNCSTMSSSYMEVIQLDNGYQDIINAIQNHYHPVDDDSKTKRTLSRQQHEIWDRIVYPTQQRIDAITYRYNVPIDTQLFTSATRLFIAGDRSSVGKSSICLGILGSILLNSSTKSSKNNDDDDIMDDTTDTTTTTTITETYTTDDVAYIKPATQSESIQLIQLYCEERNITCRSIGPLVYYRGFTRAFLANETPTTSELLYYCQRAVDRISYRKKLVIIDGVGFPAVGSICGTDNATVAYTCGYPLSSSTSSSSTEAPQSSFVGRSPPSVLLVGGPGVGGAIDAFNLNATYFERLHVPVIGAIFNKLSLDGFYSLQNCKEQIELYFHRLNTSGVINQTQPLRQPFGFLPLCTWLSNKDSAIQRMEEYFTLFQNHVDVQGILRAATSIKQQQAMKQQNPTTFANQSISIATVRPFGSLTNDDTNDETPSTKKQRLIQPAIDNNNNSSSNNIRKISSIQDKPIIISRSRKEIESMAIKSGAAPSA